MPTQEPLWIPDLTYIERMDHRVRWRRESVAVAMHDGTVGLTSQLVMRAGCPIDVRYYPFDRQACNITIASWTYATNLLYLNFTDKGAALSIVNHNFTVLRVGVTSIKQLNVFGNYFTENLTFKFYASSNQWSVENFIREQFGQEYDGFLYARARFMLCIRRRRK